MMFYENLPEALLFFPSLATDKLLALLGVGEGGLDEQAGEDADGVVLVGRPGADPLEEAEPVAAPGLGRARGRRFARGSRIRSARAVGTVVHRQSAMRGPSRGRAARPARNRLYVDPFQAVRRSQAPGESPTAGGAVDGPERGSERRWWQVIESRTPPGRASRRGLSGPAPEAAGNGDLKGEHRYVSSHYAS